LENNIREQYIDQVPLARYAAAIRKARAVTHVAHCGIRLHSRQSFFYNIFIHP